MYNQNLLHPHKLPFPHPLSHCLNGYSLPALGGQVHKFDHGGAAVLIAVSIYWCFVSAIDHLAVFVAFPTGDVINENTSYILIDESLVSPGYNSNICLCSWWNATKNRKQLSYLNPINTPSSPVSPPSHHLSDFLHRLDSAVSNAGVRASRFGRRFRLR